MAAYDLTNTVMAHHTHFFLYQYMVRGSTSSSVCEDAQDVPLSLPELEVVILGRTENRTSAVPPLGKTEDGGGLSPSSADPNSSNRDHHLGTNLVCALMRFLRYSS